MKKIIEMLEKEVREWKEEKGLWAESEVQRFQNAIDFVKEDKSLEELARIFDKKEESGIGPYKFSFDHEDLSIRRNDRRRTRIAKAANEEEAKKMLISKILILDVIYEMEYGEKPYRSK